MKKTYWLNYARSQRTETDEDKAHAHATDHRAHVALSALNTALLTTTLTTTLIAILIAVLIATLTVRITLNTLLIITMSLVISALSIGCQSDPERPLSAWTVAEWVIGDTLSDPHLDLSARAQYISQDAALDLRELSAHIKADGRLGLLSMRRPLRESWRGLYGYVRGAWTLGFWVNMSRAQNRWLISDIPDRERYQSLVNLIEEPALTASEADKARARLSLLPWVDDGAPWAGGLLGRDLSGRTLNVVPLVWAPPLIILDGVALSSEISRERLCVQLGEAFKRRAEVARAAQASYRAHVALALPAQSSTRALVDLLAWVEGAGAEQVSLIARSAQHGPTLLYLAGRAARSDAITPQRILDVHVKPNTASVSLNGAPLREISFQTIGLKTEPMRQVDTMDKLNTTLESARAHNPLSGVNVTLAEETHVADFVSLYRLLWVVDPEIAITVSPHPSRPHTR